MTRPTQGAQSPGHPQDDHIIRARCASVFVKASTRQAAQSRTASGIYDKRVLSFSVAVTLEHELPKHPGQ
jgi:hypothetical protein